MVGEITDHDLKIARQAAMSAFRSGRGIIGSEELIGEANLWLVEHMDKVTRWREEGKHGDNKLRHSIRIFCLGKVAAERKQRAGLQRGDTHWYTPSVLKEIIPDIFNRADWVGGAPAPSNDIRSASAPAEGNNRLAVILDVLSAFMSLPPADQTLLRYLYEGSGVTYDVIAEKLEVSDRTVRRREDRALERMVEILGGEPPWF